MKNNLKKQKTLQQNTKGLEIASSPDKTIFAIFCINDSHKICHNLKTFVNINMHLSHKKTQTFLTIDFNQIYMLLQGFSRYASFSGIKYYLS